MSVVVELCTLYHRVKSDQITMIIWCSIVPGHPIMVITSVHLSVFVVIPLQSPSQIITLSLSRHVTP